MPALPSVRELAAAGLAALGLLGAAGELTSCERARPPPEKYVVDPSVHMLGCKRLDGVTIAPCPDGQVRGFVTTVVGTLALCAGVLGKGPDLSEGHGVRDGG